MHMVPALYSYVVRGYLSTGYYFIVPCNIDSIFGGTVQYSTVEGGSVNRCFQVGKCSMFSKKLRCGKPGEETPTYLHGPWEYASTGRKKAAGFPLPSF
jgi:hypothetical protein